MRLRLVLIVGLLCAGLAQTQNQTHVHYVLTVEGTVQIRRVGWSKSSLAGFGTPVFSGDWFEMEPGSRATIACADLSIVELPMRQKSTAPCREEGLLAWKDEINVTRNTVQTPMVMVIAPRKTLVLDSHPLVRWLPVAGATEYRVTIGDWTSPAISETQIRYPEEAPKLQSGIGYRAIVTVAAPEKLSRISSSADLEAFSGFSVLNAEGAQQIRENESKILKLPVPRAGKALLKATLYAGSGLKAEAATQLEDLFRESGNSETALMIARVYDAVGVQEVAVSWYSKARALAHAEGRLEPEARALEGLSRTLRDNTLARSSLQQAINMYKELGSKDDVKRLTGSDATKDQATMKRK